MLTILELAQMADAVYDLPPKTADKWTLRKSVLSTTGSGLQAAAFGIGSEVIIAFKGTSSVKDGYNDLKLGVGMNTDYFSLACDFAAAFGDVDKVTLTGHSLGGAIAQVVGNRKGFKFVTFNAPGVAVFASREIAKASVTMTAIRTAGAVASAVVHPVQAAQDVRATFHKVRGVNFRLTNDAVSAMGLHYGKVITIPGTGMNPLSQHRMTTFLEVLAKSPYGPRSVMTVI